MTMGQQGCYGVLRMRSQDGFYYLLWLVTAVTSLVVIVVLDISLLT